MNSSRLRFALVLASAAFLSVGTAFADTVVSINNASFEASGDLSQSGCGVGCSYGTTAPPGWSGGGLFQPGSSSGNYAYFTSVPDGSTVGYTNSGSITQTLSTSILGGQYYTFSVYIGERADSGGNFDPLAGVMVGSTYYAVTGPASPGLGQWGLYTASFYTSASDTGKPITIVLKDGGFQGDFDDVSLSYVAAPEPSSIALLGTGLLGLAGVVRRKMRVV